MIRQILPKISLRARLVLLTAFALFSLFAAIFIAWRLARTTETFTRFQAENQVKSAVGELIQAARENPQGYIPKGYAPNSETFPDEPEKPRKPEEPKEPKKPKKRGAARPLPPHVERILATYAEPETRLSAIALHRFPQVAGGFYRAETDELFGYAPNESGLPNSIENLSQAEAIKNLARRAASENKPLTQIVSDGRQQILLAVEPPDEGDFSGENSNRISAAFAAERLPNYYGASDLPNLAALILLVSAIFGIILFTLKTVRDLQKDTQNIQTDLLALESDLSNRIGAPRTPEFLRIVNAINGLSENLRQNLLKQKLLENDLRRGEKLSALGRVASGVAHEIRNPLSAIKLKVQIARRRNYSADKLDETFQIVLSEIERLDNLVKRLLSFNKTIEMQFSEVDLRKLLQNRLNFFGELAARQNIEIEFIAGSENFEIKADEPRLTEVFDNLLQNSIAAMPDGGRLTAEIFRENESVCIKIADTGGGIEQSAREQIFEPFFTTRDEGTGLGLAIAREIVEAHKGEILFESQTKRGTTFFIKLPVDRSGKLFTRLNAETRT